MAVAIIGTFGSGIAIVQIGKFRLCNVFHKLLDGVFAERYTRYIIGFLRIVF